MKLLLTVSLALALATAACSPARSSRSGDSAPGSIISTIPDDPSQPYVISVIEDHFHDAHPTLPIGPGRTVIFRHQGLSLHNVTILRGTGGRFSRDLRPGHEFALVNASRFLGGPGEYFFFCKYHRDLGMGGVIVIAA